MPKSERYTKGLETLRRIVGESGEKVVDDLNGICPELADYIVEFSFGDIYSRPGLEPSLKAIAAVAALTAMGTAKPQLKVHIQGALSSGCTVSEVKETIVQMAVYSGFPSALNGISALSETLAERKAKGIVDAAGLPPTEPAKKHDRSAVGVKELSMLDPRRADVLKRLYGEFAPEISRFILEFAYGDVHSRDNLTKKQRQTATIAALTALGNAEPQLKFHIKGGLNSGLSVDEVKEIILLMLVVAGFPAAINAMNLLKEIVEKRMKKKGRD